MEAIVLAGGLGTRLRSVIGEALPKCMAPVGGKPFLHHLLRYLAGEGCTRVILSLGHSYRAVLDWLDVSPPPLPVDWVVEQEPLGTGGGIRLALEAARSPHVFAVNGDTFFDLRLRAMLEQHAATGAETTLALKPLQNFERYGVVGLDAESRITHFLEKAPRAEGLINGGVYCIARERFLARPFPQKFSFENDYLEAVVEEAVLYGYTADGYFIDIGVPEDHARADAYFQNTAGV